MCSLAAAMVSFAESQMLVRELAGVEVSAQRVERCAKRIGTEVSADEKERTEPIDPGAPLPQSFCLSMDGTGIPVRRSEVTGRVGKDP